MKAYGSTNTVAFRKRVKKVHAKARGAGVLYLLGSLLLAVLAFFPVLNIGSEDFWVLTFFLPIKDALGGTLDWIALISAALYLWILLAVVINFFRCFSKLGWLTKRSLKYVNGYNRNISAMEDMGKRFSGSFATILNLSLLIAILRSNNDVSVTIAGFGYVIIAVGLAIHFLAGLIAGKVSKFEVHRDGENVEEVQRECGILVYFFRNVIQLLAVALMLYFFLPECTIGKAFGSWLGGANPLEGDLVTNLVPVVLQVLIVPCMFVLIKHATAATEFNRDGMQGKGMINYRVFSFFVFLLAVGVFVVDCLFKPDSMAYNFVFVAVIAFVAFLVDCILKTREKEEEEEEDYTSICEMKKDPVMQPMPLCAQQGMPKQVGQPITVYHHMPMNQPVYQQQPVYIPVYYPYPVQQPAPAPAPAPLEVKITSMDTPAPAPAHEKAPAPEKAPENIKPEPSPAEKAKQEVCDKENARPVEMCETFDPNREWKVRCPRCGKLLSVRETSPYHRCPLCDKVFELRKFKTYVKKD